MRASKKKKLEAAGWRVGDIEDFLDLSPEEVAYIDLKVKLARGLRARREKKAMTQAEVAKLIQSSQSRVAKMEGGDPTVTIDLLMKTLIALGANEKELAGLIAK